jgi:hypothetical protein
MSTHDAASPKSKPVPKSASEREQGSRQVFNLAGIALGFKWPEDKQAIDEHGPAMAQNLAKVAGEQAALGEALDNVLIVGPYASLFAATYPLAAQLAANHTGKSFPGTVPKEEMLRRYRTAHSTPEPPSPVVQGEVIPPTTDDDTANATGDAAD